MDPNPNSLRKTPTGIEGLDEVTLGGLPTGRTTLICGSAGSGKTVFGLEFLVHGILDYGEPGVFLAFEETAKDLAQNVASFGYDLDQLQKYGKLAIDHVFIERSEIEETGEYDLEGLFIRLGNAVDTVKAKRVVLDTIEVLFAGLQNQSIIRSELRRLFRWLKDRGLTAIVTGERGEGALSRYGLEEYVADCVILLDHRVTDQISTRRLRVVKYRGSLHGTDEYPFLMGESGISVLPITSVGLTHTTSTERISSGVPDLDKMLTGKGFFRGSSILVSGTAGTGKSSMAVTFLKAACERGERALYFGFEESMDQIIRNNASIGLDLRPWVDKGLLHFHNVRPSSLGLEAHLASMHQSIKQVDPKVVVMDPITNFISGSDVGGVKSMLTRLVDFLKMRGITAMFTHLSTLGGRLESTDENVSSIMDTWLLLRDIEHDGRRSYALYVLKSRGMAHSHEMRAFMLTDHGIRLGAIFTKGLDSPDKKPAIKRAAVQRATSIKGGSGGRKR
ncbi:MAG: circadian clock protein KaiC [Candidatus Korobacteraceae bacterium]